MTTAVAPSSARGRLLALVVRPFGIFFGLTAMGYLLLRSAPGVRLDGYPSWLRDFAPLSDDLTTQAGVTLQLAIGASVVGVVLGALFGALMRAKAFAGPLSGLSVLVLAVAGPGLSVLALYWLVIRFDLGLALGSVAFSDDPGEAVNRLIAPSLAVGLVMAPSLAPIAASRGMYSEPYGMAAAAGPLASRAESREVWRFGFPAGLLIGGLIAAEVVFARAGLASALATNLFRGAGTDALDTLAMIALGGAALALVVDLVGMRPHNPMGTTGTGLRLAGYSSDRPGQGLLITSLIGLTAVVVAAVSGELLGTVEADPSESFVGPLSDGHLLGTDVIGRDLASLTLTALAPALIAALAPSALALIAGLGLVLAQRRLGPVGEVLPGAAIDVLWWPLPILVMFAYSAFGGSDEAATNPTILLFLAAGLVPHAFRMLRRESIWLDTAGWLRVLGLWFVLATMSLLAIVTAAFVGFDSLGDPSGSLGRLLGEGRAALTVSTWPAVVPSVALAIVLISLYGLGSSLIRLGWYRSAEELIGADMGDDDTQSLVIPLDLQDYPSVFDDPTGPLAPNYDLQPGLPRPDDHVLHSDQDETVTLTELPIIPPPPAGRDDRF